MCSLLFYPVVDFCGAGRRGGGTRIIVGVSHMVSFAGVFRRSFLWRTALSRQGAREKCQYKACVFFSLHGFFVRLLAGCGEGLKC